MPGCYGKIPALGDFLSRSLPGTFVEAWDAWLRKVLAACAREGNDDWIGQYLAGPVWRFAYGPGTLGAAARAGILVPSVDSIGRCFPLTIVLDIPESLSAIQMVDAWAEGYERAEMIAIGVIGRALTPEAFVDRVASLPDPLPGPATPAVERWTEAAAPGLGVRATGAPDEAGGARDLTSTLAFALAAGNQNGVSLWWHLDWEDRPASTLLFAGLPSPEAARGMLVGSWKDWGWQG